MAVRGRARRGGVYSRSRFPYSCGVPAILCILVLLIVLKVDHPMQKGLESKVRLGRMRKKVNIQYESKQMTSGTNKASGLYIKTLTIANITSNSPLTN